MSTFMCREDGGGNDADVSNVLTDCVEVRRRHRHPRNHAHALRPNPRHSYYEGSTPESYLLTAALIHSLKHGSGKLCAEPHCQLCNTTNGRKLCKLSERQQLPESKSDYTELEIIVPEYCYGRSVSQEGTEPKNWKHVEKSCLNLPPYEQGLSHISPLSSPSSSFQYAQISPLSSPHSSVAPGSTSVSLYPNSSVTSGDSSLPLLESEFSSLDISSLTDVTVSSSLLSGSALSLHKADCLESSTEMTASELSLATTADCSTLIGSFPSETNISDTVSSETFPCESFPKYLNSNVMSSSVHSLPSRLTLKDRAASPSLLRPILLSSGSLVLLPRRPSLVSPTSVSSVTSSQGHFLWEELDMECVTMEQNSGPRSVISGMNFHCYND
ncbi:hypothetical protein SK128_018944 [Halocaridina rubra]|uniref:Uncharacterized protein n=1 Tax=Halocaridina rubra TaxID=373956 RepID=A0AAN8WGB2_HALRR